MAASLAIAASLAMADSDLGTVGDYTYIQDGAPSAAAPATLTADAACPAGTHVTGGGPTNITSPAGEYFVSSNAPFDGPDGNRDPDDGWRTTAANNAGDPKPLSVTGVCSGGRLTYASRRGTAEPASARQLTARCPAGTRVTGGGARLGGPIALLWLNSSYPIDAGDGDTKPDDGWRARGYNNSGLAEAMKVFAICADLRVRYVSSAGIDPNYTFVHCPGTTHVTGGGLRITGAADEAHVNSIDPFADAVNPPDDGIVGLGANNSGPPKTVTTFALCAR